MTKRVYAPHPPGCSNEELLDLADIIHARVEKGEAVVVPDPGTEYGRALVLALGAQIKEPNGG